MKIHSSLITKLLTILLSVAAVLFVTSCDDENPPSIPTRGNLIGSVQTFDDKTASTGDNVGVLITASNLTGQTFTTFPLTIINLKSARTVMVRFGFLVFLM
jgi:hypothetical protein